MKVDRDHSTMFRRFRWIQPLVLTLLAGSTELNAFQVETNFPGASIQVFGIDAKRQALTFSPTQHPGKGWACWWHFRLTGIQTNRPIALTLIRTSAFGRPTRAMFSHDGVNWHHTEPGVRIGANQIYRHQPTHDTIHFAWGPPFQLQQARALVQRVLDRDPSARASELCRSREGRPVPALRWEPANPAAAPRRGLWVEARQHAWESGSSWVCQGFLEWLISDAPEARKLKQHTRIVVVPIMDVDNVERGAGGKDQLPHDHNRDWSDRPHWPEVTAAQRGILEMSQAGEFDLFLDLHNPGPGDKTPFFYGSPETHLPPIRKAHQKRFHETTMKHLGAEPLGLSPIIRVSGPGYHPLWRHISKNWVAENTAERVVALTLETSWNTSNSTRQGYVSYGHALGRAVAEYLDHP